MFGIRQTMKKLIMRQYWRIQQSQAVVSMAFWTTTLTLIIWPYVKWRFDDSCNGSLCFSDEILGISSTYFGLMIIGIIVLLTVFLIGYVYDVGFGLWKEHLTISTERNPFGVYLISPPTGLILAQTNLLLKHLVPEDEDVQRHVAFVERWLEWNADEEIWARAMDAWKNNMGDEDPHMPFLSKEMREDLESRSSTLPKE
ncbi:MAG: hypothetical protein HOJ55_00935 [Euryarchaeota archaeon]|jgi:hypothetical protein|nr:hypothetical protein [Euryarchaeota archaeon]MBT5592395.1 hypothetical protein [Euryarchaeota archaeon]